jgi:hypothetical protein
MGLTYTDHQPACQQKHIADWLVLLQTCQPAWHSHEFVLIWRSPVSRQVLQYDLVNCLQLCGSEPDSEFNFVIS